MGIIKRRRASISTASRSERLRDELRGRTRRRRSRAAFAVVVLTGSLVAVAAHADDPVFVQHGIGFTKGCNSTVNIGALYTCTQSIRNNLDEADDTLTISNIVDTVHGANGDVSSPANFFKTAKMDNIDPISHLATTASCSGVGMTGSGSVADPWTGVDLCTLPAGSRIHVAGIPFYAVQSADYGLPNHALPDSATLTWGDLCDDPAGTGNSNCVHTPQTNASASQSIVTKFPSFTTTTIHNAAHGPVTAVVAGTTVHDFVHVAGAAGKPAPSGNVSVDWFTNNQCTGAPATSSVTLGPLDASGDFDATSFSFTPAAGQFAFKAHYLLGDDLYLPSDGACEPLAVVNAKITIAANKTNRVGDPHTFTVTLSKDLGAGFVAATDEHVDVVLTDSNGASHSAPTGSCTTAGVNTDAAGQCTITFTSNTTGKVTAHATSTLSLLGASVTVQTDGSASNSVDAVKTYVNAKIAIAPSATNRIGQSHTFTVTLSQDIGDGNGFVAAPGQHVDVVLTGHNGAVPSAPTGTCTNAGANTDAAGTCTITFTSNTTGTVSGHASSTLSVAGSAAFTVQTDGSAPNSADAVKTFVNAKIAIAPDATNAVGDPHTFTVTLMKDAGDGLGFVPAAAEHVGFTLTDSNGAAHTAPTGTCTGAGPNTNASGQCTIIFTSNSAGKVTGHASSSLSVAGSAAFTVATDGVALNSADAVKTFVDANISITPATATNPVNTDHTLTGHVNVNAGNGSFANAPDGTTITFVILAGSVGAFDGPASCLTAGGTGSCTVQIKSTTPGTTTVQASTTVSVGGISLTRTTGDGLHSDGANAVKLWADDVVTTNVRDTGGADVTGTTLAGGTVVHDEATVTKAIGTPAAVPNPTGTVDFTLFNTNNCTGNPIATDPGKALNASGVASSVTFTVPAAAGAYSYLAHYNGQTGVYPAHDAVACEPFSVAPAFTDNLTPGFWKNHEKATSALLPQTLGNHVVSLFSEAKIILSGMGCGHDGRLNCMAGMLLAAELNLQQGGSTCIGSLGAPLDPTTVLGRANLLLIKYSYTGFKSYTLTSADSALAQTLHDQLSAYNIDGVPTC